MAGAVDLATLTPHHESEGAADRSVADVVVGTGFVLANVGSFPQAWAAAEVAHRSGLASATPDVFPQLSPAGAEPGGHLSWRGPSAQHRHQGHINCGRGRADCGTGGLWQPLRRHVLSKRRVFTGAGRPSQS
ncbi:hypothetical protein BN6_00550 [Saccharothrix espanaensis DSM 44229]|uniref:Uncharacterized protein n=1 Tax=Saccharothrix espanaensis (strain ATCC 51144 / DSM 44229 / JCM 9112 / NBRC 15066 / NRRL 15764) TaxID=1179773 RepID=K3W430_SACES|nr:hypothetical protein BN6_00550 [Saccharothrix espanaensis DSM 44229]